MLPNLKSYIPKHLPKIKVADDFKMLIEDWCDSGLDMTCDDDNPREMSFLIYKLENESVEKLFDMLQALPGKSDVDQWQMNDESDEEDDLVSWSEEGSSLDEITDYNDSNLKIKMATESYSEKLYRITNMAVGIIMPVADADRKDAGFDLNSRAAPMTTTDQGSRQNSSFCQWASERGRGPDPAPHSIHQLCAKREMSFSTYKFENESEEKLFDILPVFPGKSDIDQWQMYDESDEEDDFVSWSGEGNSLDEITDSNDSNLRIKMAAESCSEKLYRITKMAVGAIMPVADAD